MKMNCGWHKLLTSYYNGGIKCFRKASLKIVSSPKSLKSPGELIYISISIIYGDIIPSFNKIIYPTVQNLFLKITFYSSF